MKRSPRVLLSVAAALAILIMNSGCGGRQADWETARKADTAQAYQQFLQRYPGGDFTSQARARIEDLKEEADWKTALTTDTAAAYQQFLGLHPESARADEARIRVENLNLAQAPANESHAAASGPGGPATAAAAAGKYRVQLGAFTSATRARSEWQTAVRNHHTELTGLGYTLDKVTLGERTVYRLQSTAVIESRARSICIALKAARQDCVVVLP